MELMEFVLFVEQDLPNLRPNASKIKLNKYKIRNPPIHLITYLLEKLYFQKPKLNLQKIPVFLMCKIA